MRAIAIEWARTVLANPTQWAILDTETTGLSKRDEVIQLGIYGVEETTLIESLVKPRGISKIHPAASKVNGITMVMLRGAPTLSMLAAQIRLVTGGRRMIAYNAPFDRRLLDQSASTNGIGPFDFPWECAMEHYTNYLGKKTRLPGGDHSAIGDCIATLNIIKAMAR